jgi:Putative metallopeptidase
MNHYFSFITRPAALTVTTLMIVGMMGIYTSRFGKGVASAQAKPTGKGLFKVGASPLRKDKNIKLKMTAEDRKDLQAVATDLNKVFILPQDIYLSVNDCGQANAFFDPDTKEIIMCTELVKYLEQAFAKEFKDKAEAAEAVDDSTMFVFFHELGHALIDLYDLPVTGKEEDAVDQLSTLIVGDGSPEGAASVYNGAMFFAITDEGDLDESAFWDEHSMGRQRFYNIICQLYGQDPKAHKDLVNEEVLPKARAQRCPSEYQRIEKAWGTLLSPHIKN